MMFMPKMVIIFLEGFIEVNYKHRRNVVLFENCEDICNWFHSSVMFAKKTRLNPSIFDGKSCLCMNACMHDYAKERGVV